MHVCITSIAKVTSTYCYTGSFSTTFKVKNFRKNEREAIMQNTFHVVKVDQVLRKENAVAAANAV